MKKSILSVAIVLTLISATGLQSCIGSFALSNKVLSWNRNVSNKFVNELVFIAFWVLPVYEVTALADLLVINSIEFWSGNNPMLAGRTMIDGNDGRYLVDCDGHGYTITSQADGSMVRLDFDAENSAWDVTVGDETHRLMTFVDDTHVQLPAADGSWMTVELSEAGLMAYRNAIATPLLAVR